ncbi:MAG: hypothetical protein AAFU73_04260 [Planctomycetota bacterium]
MNAVNRAVTTLFDVLLTPLEAIGDEFALIVVSGVFGVLALVIFKQISWQKGIKATKDKIKAHLIEIRIYQDDLGVVAKAIGKILLRNLQYVTLNFGPFIPLAVPFAFVAAQLVVRYGFEPAPVQQTSALVAAGDGQTLIIEGEKAAIAGLEVVFPEGLEPVSPLARIASQGNAEVEFIASGPGSYELLLRTPGGETTKRIVVGDGTGARAIQDRRVHSALEAILWPAEDTLSPDSGLTSVRFRYAESDLGWLPMSGPFGVLANFVLASMLFGVLALKPLGVQI